MGEDLFIAALCVDCAGEVRILEEPVQVGQPQAAHIPVESTILNPERDTVCTVVLVGQNKEGEGEGGGGEGGGIGGRGKGRVREREGEAH